MLVKVLLILILGRKPVSDTQLNLAETRILAHEVRNYYKNKFGVKLRIRVRSLRDPAPSSYQGGAAGIPRLGSYSDWAYNHGLLNQKQIVHFITPRTSEGYMLGFGGESCFLRHSSDWFKDKGRLVESKGVVSYSTGQLFNIAGNPRFIHSIVAAEHEIAHDLGAGHTASNTLMNLNPLPLVREGEELDPDLVTVKQIKRCANGHI